MTHWVYDAVFYHIYPLGFCGTPQNNDFQSPPVPRLEQIYSWLDHIQSLGANALYLGPLFESTSHGYDTADYYHVDRRLGDDNTLMRLSSELHRRGMRLVLDGVFNHVGRDFWAFRDVLKNGQSSPYCDWFHNLRFDRRGPYDYPFTYEGWNGHYNLVKLNLHHPAVRDHLFQAVRTWVTEFNIDGLRLDAVDVIDPTFLRDLAAFCRSLRPDFWLMGEVVHGDYRRWVNPGMLDSVTNYECYKSLYSSHVDRNYFEIAYALNRQFGSEGIYRDLPLYAFADNHDVNRVASNLTNPAHLYPLYCLLFTMPGVPSVYYGSEWGIPGKKNNGSDHPLRPHLDLAQVSSGSPQRDLAQIIAHLATIRRSLPALRLGSYHQLYINHQQLAFARQVGEQWVIVAVNAAEKSVSLKLELPAPLMGTPNLGVRDVLNTEDGFNLRGRNLEFNLHPHWARILVPAQS